MELRWVLIKDLMDSPKSVRVEYSNLYGTAGDLRDAIMKTWRAELPKNVDRGMIKILDSSGNCCLPWIPLSDIVGGSTRSDPLTVIVLPFPKIGNIHLIQPALPNLT